MIAAPASIITPLGHKRKRGRRPFATGAGNTKGFDKMKPPAHLLQDPNIIAGLSPPNQDVVAEEALFTFYFLLFSFYFLLFTFYFLVFTFYFLVFTFYFLLFSFYFLLFSF